MIQQGRSWSRTRTERLGLVATLGLILVAVVLSGRASAAAKHCNAAKPDTDHDNIVDCWEPHNGLKVGTKDQHSDKDGDGLQAIDEYQLDLDTKNNGIMHPYQADLADTNGNKITDGYEDLDGDGYSNLTELLWKTDPLDVGSIPELVPPGGCAAVPGSIPSDGERNVTPLLQAVIDAVPDNNCIEFPAGARYRSNGTLWITWRNNLTIEGNGAKLFTDKPGKFSPLGKSGRRHIFILGGTNITLDGLVIRGPDADGKYKILYEGEAGVHVAGGTDVTLSNLTISKVYGDAVYIAKTGFPPGSGNIVPATNVLVTGGTFTTIGRHGVGIGASVDGITIDDNVIDGVGRSLVDIEPISGQTLQNIWITHNTFKNPGLNVIAGAGHSPVTDVYIGFNTIVGHWMIAKVGPYKMADGSPPPYRHARWTFEGNVSDTPLRGSLSPYTFRWIDDVTVIDNVQPFNPGGAGEGVFVDAACNVTAAGNDFTGAASLFDGDISCNVVDGGGNST